MRIAATLALVMAPGLAGVAGAQEPGKVAATPTPGVAAVGKVLATFAGAAVTAEQAESILGPQLARARQQEYEVLSEGLRDHAFKELQAREANRLGISLEELYAKKVTEAVPEPAKDEVDGVLTQYRDRLPPDDNEARQQVVSFLKGQQTHLREQAWKGELLAASGFRLLVDPPRMSLGPAAGDPVWGPADAPVTVFEFSDFQCPYCQRVQPTLKRLRTEYPGKVRMVFKQLPLPMHQQARLAAEASLCANAQGKFWELHEWLFANQGGVTEEAVKKTAADLKLEVPAFEKCLAEHTFAGKVDADLALDEKLGVSSTPFFLINGRIVEGAQPFDAFKQILDDELARVPAPPAAAALPTAAVTTPAPAAQAPR